VFGAKRPSLPPLGERLANLKKVLLFLLSHPLTSLLLYIYGSSDDNADILSYVFATPTGRWGRFTLTLAYSTKTGCARGVLLDARAVEIKDFKDQMYSMKSVSGNPLLAPVVLLQACTRILSSRLQRLNTTLGRTRFDNYMKRSGKSAARLHKAKPAAIVSELAVDIEKGSGTGVETHQSLLNKSNEPVSRFSFRGAIPPPSLDSAEASDGKKVEEEDYSDRTNIFNHIAAESGFCELRINSIQHTLESMRACNKYLAMLPATQPQNSLEKDTAVLEEQMQFLASQLHNLLLRAQFLQQTAQTQISAVSKLY
jgi:hypothetical protein